jgi:hypothetical protein
MAIFAIRSSQNVNEDSQQNGTDTTKRSHVRQNSASRPTAVAPESMIQFDDDTAHFVTHLDADPLAECGLKMHLVEYPLDHDSSMIREIPDEEEDYTYLRFRGVSNGLVSSRFRSYLMLRSLRFSLRVARPRRASTVHLRLPAVNHPVNGTLPLPFSKIWAVTPSPTGMPTRLVVGNPAPRASLGRGEPVRSEGSLYIEDTGRFII